MSALLVEFEAVIRTADDTADLVTISAELAQPPQGDGASFDPITGQTIVGAYTVQVLDVITGGTDRLITSQMEDAAGRDRLGNLKASFRVRTNGGAWATLIAGYLTRYALVSDGVWELTVSDPSRAAREFTAFAPKKGTVILTADVVTGATAAAVQALPLPMVAGTSLNFGGTGLGRAITLAADAAAGATTLTIDAYPNSRTIAAGEQTSYTESLASYLARWPQRGCVLGGPIVGGFGPLQPLPGWEVKLSSNTTPAYLQFVSGYAAPNFTRVLSPATLADPINQAVADRYRQFNGTPSPRGMHTVADAQGGSWPGLVVELRHKSGALAGYFNPKAPGPRYVDEGGNQYHFDGERAQWLVQPDKRPGLFVLAIGTPPSSETLFCRCYTAEPSELSPIFWDGPPTDLMGILLDEAGIPYDAASRDATRDAIGADLYFAGRFTSTLPLADLLAKLQGAFGIGLRPNAAGALEFFPTRLLGSLDPAVDLPQLTDADVHQGTTEAFALDTGEAYALVRFRHQRLVPTTRTATTQVNGFALQTETIERTNGDGGGIGTATAEFDLPGMVHHKDAWDLELAPITGWVDALASQIFDRYGRGPVRAQTMARRGDGSEVGDTLTLGAETFVILPQVPNHNKRLGDDLSVPGRAMQIVHHTPSLAGYTLELVSSGPSAQPVATLPVLAIAASLTDPLRIAAVTITNAAALNDAGIGVRLRMATGVGAAPAAGAYTDVKYFRPGEVPTAAIDLPAVTPGRTVGVIARSEQPDARPSNWTAPVTVTLVVLDAPTAVTATPDASDASRCVVAWTIGANAGAARVDVFLRLATELSAAAVRQNTLEPGSTGYTLRDLTPGADYVVGVQHREAARGETSALVEVSFTAGASAPTPVPPEDPFPFAGQQDASFGLPQLDGLYGLAVAATVLPSLVEVLEAVETAPGSGTFGAAVVVGRVGAVQGDWTLWQNVAPDDGLARQLTARTVASNGTSAETDPVQVVPWTPLPLLPYATASGVRALRNWRRVAEDALTRTFGFVWGALVFRAWVYLRERPIFDTTSNPYPNPDDPSDSLVPDQVLKPEDGDTLVVTKPTAGLRLYGQVEARDRDLRVTWLRRFVIEPTGALAVLIAPRESAGSGSLDITVTDPAGVLAAVHPVQFRRTVDQATTVVDPSTTSGSRYTRTEPLDPKHSVRLEPLLHYADGTQQVLAAYTFDADRIADVIAGPTVSYDGSTATVTARYDTDATAGAAQAFYRYDGGAWTPLTVAADLTIAFSVDADITATHTVEFYALNPDGSEGPVTTVTIDKLGIVEGVVDLSVPIVSVIDSTHVSVDCTRSGFPSGTTFNITLLIDGMAPGVAVTGKLDSDFPVAFTTPSAMGGSPSGLVTIDALIAGQIVATTRHPGFFAL